MKIKMLMFGVISHMLVFNWAKEYYYLHSKQYNQSFHLYISIFTRHTQQ